MEEKRNLKVIFNRSGGTASKGGITSRITLPIAWVREMGLNPEDREIIATYDGEKIIIEKGKKDEKRISNKSISSS